MEVPEAAEKPLSVKAERHPQGRSAAGGIIIIIGLTACGGAGIPSGAGEGGEVGNPCPPWSSLPVEWGALGHRLCTHCW